MTQMEIEVDSEKLAAVAALLGCSTPDQTIDRALDEVIALARRRGLLELSAVAGGDELADERRRRDAWS